MERGQHAVVVGGGVGGLTAALALGRGGHRVTLLERDVLPVTGDADAAFAAERRGAPQVHQTHGLLARLQVVLRQRFPDVLDALLAAGARTMPTTTNLGDPQPGDDDLRVIIARRTTLEWVLRQAVLAEPSVEIRTGVAVTGLASNAPATITGVTLDDGRVVGADLTVVSTGRRGDIPGWVHAATGVEVPETVVESGLMYLTRWYRLPPLFDTARLDPKLGGDLGFLKFLGVPGDGNTLSITLAVRPDDGRLRNALSDTDGFERACRALPGPSQFFADGPLDPIGGVRPMGGLLNRLRRFVDDDGEPTVLGIHAIGDAHTCTNPLYGRGCALAAVQAVLVADALDAHPDDPTARARAYEAACRREVEPWFHVAVQMDRMGADPAGGPARKSRLAAVFKAAETDPVLGRGMARFWNLLATPDELAADRQYTVRVAAVLANPERYPVPPREGPTREELLDTLTTEEAAHA